VECRCSGGRYRSTAEVARIGWDYHRFGLEVTGFAQARNPMSQHSCAISGMAGQATIGCFKHSVLARCEARAGGFVNVPP